MDTNQRQIALSLLEGLGMTSYMYSSIMAVAFLALLARKESANSAWQQPHLFNLFNCARLIERKVTPQAQYNG
jgi:hypothetical protein